MLIANLQQQITLPNVWYTSQLGTLFFAFLSLITNIKATYILAYYCVAISFVISLYQSLTTDQKKNDIKNLSESTKKPLVTSADARERIIEFVNTLKPLTGPAKTHATTPYILLSLAYIFLLPKSTLTLIPYAIFAFFHALNYTRTFVLPRLGLNSNIQSRANMIMELVNNRFHAPAFKAAVWSQLFTFTTTVLVTIVNFPLNLIGYGDGHTILNFSSVLIWFSFISAVMKDNLLMRAAINEVIAIADGVAMDPRVPPQAREAWSKAKQIITYKNVNNTK